jgi:hypothetical protein
MAYPHHVVLVHEASQTDRFQLSGQWSWRRRSLARRALKSCRESAVGVSETEQDL